MHNQKMSDTESMQFDILIVGAGPSGLAAAIRLGQLSKEKNLSLRIAVLEKGAEVSSHILSGAVFEPGVLSELLPNWKELGVPLEIPAIKDSFSLLTKTRAWRLPVPPQMNNKGNFIIRLGELCRFLADQATQLGIEIFPGFAATGIIFDDPTKPQQVLGVKTGDMGRDKHHQPKTNFQVGIHLYASYTLFAEGCRGSLTEKLIQQFSLDKDSDPQTYGLGIKEVWSVNSPVYHPGEVWHTIGWPLPNNTYGGSFVYHLNQQQVAIGFVVGLDYQNPYLNPFEEFQRFKQHPSIKPLLTGGERIAYGARSLNEGGLQAIPHLIFPGGAIIGCAAGFLNVPKIKGSHTAMKSGMLAAEAIVEAWGMPSADAHLSLSSQAFHLSEYPEKIRKSWIWDELSTARNIRPAFIGCSRYLPAARSRPLDLSD
jgi:electron-transferring-flavoprotein dehydrogenase